MQMPVSRTINLVTRVLLAIVIAGLVPLLWVAITAMVGYGAASQQARTAATTALDDTSLAAVQLRTEQSAKEVGHFLDARAADARAVALLPPDRTAYARFAASHRVEVWWQTGSRAAPVQERPMLPIYREIIATDASGRLLARLVDNQPQTDPGDVALLAAYVAEAKALAPDALSVSHLVRRYIPRPANAADLAPGADYKDFNGVYRFIAARRTANGAFDGAVMLALDARHLMEFACHIQPVKELPNVVWPDVDSGNFATMYDDQGWAISHPNLWTVRGDDAMGKPVPAVTVQSTPMERHSHPFNAVQSGGDPNLPGIFEKARAGQAGFITTKDRDGVPKAATFAPIPFAEGAYKNGFGALVIDAQTEEFHRAATTVSATIDNERGRLQLQIGLVMLVALAALLLVGVLISRMLVRPITRLTAAARQLEQGEFNEEPLNEIRNRRFGDEVTVLAQVFAEMGRQVVKRERQLKTQIADLHIQIDSGRRQQQVNEIVETDYFRDLRANANRLRARSAAATLTAATPTAAPPGTETAPSAPAPAPAPSPSPTPTGDPTT